MADIAGRIEGTPRPGRIPTRRWIWFALLGVSAAALVATPIVVAATRPDPDAGAVPATVRLGASARPDASVRPPGAMELRPAMPSAASVPSLLAIVVRSALLEDYRAPRSPAPTSLRIDAIGLVAPVVPVGVEGDGRTVEVPADVDTIGWYRFGPAPGTDGSAVLLGHVDSHVQGAGAFFRLREIRPGDVVTVRFADDSRSSFRVVGRRSFPKDELPAELFHRSGLPVLTLVTCGGAFDSATRSYADNVVVFAVPAH